MLSRDINVESRSWCAVGKVDDESVCMITLHRPYLNYQELGWGCYHEYRNKGYTSGTLLKFLPILSRRLPGAIICATTMLDNIASQRTALGAGMVEAPLPLDFKSGWTTSRDIKYFYYPR